MRRNISHYSDQVQLQRTSFFAYQLFSVCTTIDKCHSFHAQTLYTQNNKNTYKTQSGFRIGKSVLFYFDFTSQNHDVLDSSYFPLCAIKLLLEFAIFSIRNCKQQFQLARHRILRAIDPSPYPRQDHRVHSQYVEWLISKLRSFSGFACV